jgi:hypothetical protein
MTNVVLTAVNISETTCKDATECIFGTFSIFRCAPVIKLHPIKFTRTAYYEV